MMSDNRKKIGVLVKPVEDGKSGSGSHLRQVLLAIKPLLDRELLDIYLIHYKDIKKLESEVPGYKYIKVARNPLLASWQLSKINFSVIHYSPLTIFSPIFVKCSKVATLHGDAQSFLKTEFSLLNRLHKRIVVRLYSKFMSHIFTVSETSQAFLVKEYGLNPSRISLVRNAVSDSFYPASKQKISEFKKAKSIQSPFIFHLSKFSARKNPWVLLKAFGELVSEYDAELFVGGYGWDNEQVRAFLKKHGIDKRIRLLGFLSEHEINLYLNSASLFVFPSLYEGFGMPNLEAMKCLCPVISTRRFAIPEVVGNAALLMENPHSEDELKTLMLKVLTDSEIRENLIRNGIENLKRFCWEDSARQSLSVYSSLIH